MKQQEQDVTQGTVGVAQGNLAVNRQNAQLRADENNRT